MHYQIHAVEGVTLQGPIAADHASDRDALDHARTLAVNFARERRDEAFGVHFVVEDERHNLVGSVAVKFLAA